MFTKNGKQLTINECVSRVEKMWKSGVNKDNDIVQQLIEIGATKDQAKFYLRRAKLRAK